ncbi:protein MpNRPE1a [Marchantia polymorpha subsp. ruderalis]
MEGETPEAGEPPLADVRGIQFGLMTTSVMLKLSVFDPNQSLTKAKELVSARLGLPTISGQCTTCTATSVDKCQGHFGHVLLPTPIFHPNHVGRLIRLLRKVCLNCGKLKKKPVGRTRTSANEQTLKKGKKNGGPKKTKSLSEDPILSNGTSRRKRKFSSFIDDEAEASEVIVLSSEDEELSSNGRKQQKSPDSIVEEDILGGKASTSSAKRSWNGKRKNQADTSETNSTTTTPTVVDLTDMLVCVKKSKKPKVSKSKSGVEVVDDAFCSSPRDDNFTSDQICLYCSATSHSDRFPEVQLKVDVKEGNRGDMLNLAKSIRMEIKDKDYKNVAPNYWSFVGGNSTSTNQNVQKTRNLLPSEALKIIRKIPVGTLAKLGMQLDVAHPEALIVECLPVPPNCSRLQEDPFSTGGTNIGFKIGFDRASQAFTKLLNKINSIRASRYGRPTFHAAGMEASGLQALFGQYLREKGAPKAAPGKEKKRTDHVGRVQKRDSRWSLDWLKRNVLGKRSGFSARNVVTGDPFLTVEEIGVPLEVAKYLTYPVRVNRLNQSKLQECVEIGQDLGRSRACGAVRIVKDGEKMEVTPKSAHHLEIGDIVHRHLSDGDLLYINRPPSLHKHSLIALKTHIQDSATFTINPAVCAPLHADFDGDCLHVFVPQSEETKAELHQLLTVPEQILPSPEGKTIIGLSQDNILATHLVTSSPLFVDKELMHQLAMWSSWKLPVPTIVKAPRGGGPLWTGKQIIDLTIPDDFSYRNHEGSTVIQDGELLSYGGTANWLASTSGLVSTLARHDPATAVKHLDCSQSVLREWLLSHGFSVSLKDFYAAPHRDGRKEIKEEILGDLEEAQCMATNKQFIFDRNHQKLKASRSGRNGTSRTTRGNRLQDLEVSGAADATCRASRMRTDGQKLEGVAVTYFLDKFSQLGDQIGEKIDCDNSLLAMVRAGSKGSMAKAFQQIGCLGLQLYKGEHLLALEDNNKLCTVAGAVGYLERWEGRGLVRSSLLDGLEPLEFFLHAIAVRAGLLRQSLEVTEPGELFKRLMLFLRDIHISYDGTVRNKCGLEIIQFLYDGVKPPEFSDNVSINFKESVMPGEAVGILAATAIAQPAYQVMLEANHNIGSKKIRPLELLQETMFPRSTSSLKDSDRRSILRLSECDCGKLYCDERRILQIQSELQPITLQTMAISTAIEYIPDTSDEWDAFYVKGERCKICLPWVGHILLDKIAMLESGLNTEKILEVLNMKFEGYRKDLRKYQLGRPLFGFREDCSCMDSEDRELGPCLHFSPMPKSNVKRRKQKVSKDDTVEILEILQNFLIPLILDTTVKGDDRIESTKIVWEDEAWSTPGRSIHNECFSEEGCGGELVLEVLVKQKLSTKRGVPWMITTEACLQIEDAIDWRRSSPYSVQEIKYAFGVEAARDCILQRFNLATQASGNSIEIQHLKLVADLMVHSGEVHGLTSFGYTDLMRSLKTTAPFTAGAFRAPIKNFMDAAEKGDGEEFNGVLASCVFGKRVPIGTGADFSLKVDSKRSCLTIENVENSIDIHECLIDLDSKIGIERPETPPHSEVEVGDVANDSWLQNTDGWGSHDKSAASKGGWGGEGGGWGSPEKSAAPKAINSGGWGEEGGWDSPGKSGPTKEASTGGWGDSYSTPADNSRGGDWESTPVPEVGVWELHDQNKDAPATKASDSSWAEKDAAPELEKSAGWADAGNVEAAAWVSEDTSIQCSGVGSWAWGSASKSSQLLSSPKVAESRWNEDAVVQVSQSSWGSLPSGKSSGWGERPSEAEKRENVTPAKDKECSSPIELCSAKGSSQNSSWSEQKVTGTIVTGEGQSGGNWIEDCPSATPGTWSVDHVKNRSEAAREISWTCEDDTICQNSQSTPTNAREDLDSSKKKGLREFRPTGANTIPLGKVRLFTNLAIDVPVSKTLVPPSDSDIPGADGGKELVGDGVVTGPEKDVHFISKSSESPSVFSQPSGPPGAESDRNHRGHLRQLAGNSANEVEGATLWMTTEDHGCKDTDPGWSSLTVDSQITPADPTRGPVSAGGHKNEEKIGWLPPWRKDGPGHFIQGHGTEPQTVGGRGVRRDLIWKKPEIKREIDNRRESEDWKELETLVRSVKNILKKCEPEERLVEEDHNLLSTQVLPNHPNSAAKVGCGIDYFKVATYMDTKCFFLVRKDGTSEDFSYHKCLQTLASKKNASLGNLYKNLYMSRRKVESRPSVEDTSRRGAETQTVAEVQAERTESATEFATGELSQGEVGGCTEPEPPSF